MYFFKVLTIFILTFCFAAHRLIIYQLKYCSCALIVIIEKNILTVYKFSKLLEMCLNLSCASRVSPISGCF